MLDVLYFFDFAGGFLFDYFSVDSACFAESLHVVLVLLVNLELLVGEDLVLLLEDLVVDRLRPLILLGTVLLVEVGLNVI